MSLNIPYKKVIALPKKKVFIGTIHMHWNLASIHSYVCCTDLTRSHDQSKEELLRGSVATMDEDEHRRAEEEMKELLHLYHLHQRDESQKFVNKLISTF